MILQRRQCPKLEDTQYKLCRKTKGVEFPTKEVVFEQSFRRILRFLEQGTDMSGPCEDIADILGEQVESR